MYLVVLQPGQRTLDPRDADKRSLPANHGLQVGRRVRPPTGGADPAQRAEDQRPDLYAQRIPVDRSRRRLGRYRDAGRFAYGRRHRADIRRLCRGEPHRLPDGRRQRRAVPFGAQYPDDDLQYTAFQCVPPDGAGRRGQRFGRDMLRAAPGRCCFRRRGRDSRCGGTASDRGFEPGGGTRCRADRTDFRPLQTVQPPGGVEPQGRVAEGRPGAGDLLQPRGQTPGRIPRGEPRRADDLYAVAAAARNHPCGPARRTARHRCRAAVQPVRAGSCGFRGGVQRHAPDDARHQRGPGYGRFHRRVVQRQLQRADRLRPEMSAGETGRGAAADHHLRGGVAQCGDDRRDPHDP